MIPEYLGASAALPTGTGISPPREGNLPITTTSKLEGKLTLVTAVTTLQQASSAPAIRRSKMKQAESTVDQLRNRPLEGITTNGDYTIIVMMFTRNAHTQIEMGRGLPPVAPFGNPLIIEQSRERWVFGKIPVARHQVESIINTRTSVMTRNTRTAAEPQQDVMIKSAKAL